MSDLGIIQTLQNYLFELKEAEQSLDKQIVQIRDVFTAGKFIPQSLSDAAAENLNQVISLQKQIIQQYQSLEIGDIPSAISEMEQILTERRKSAEERAEYREGIEFFCHLCAKDREIQENLAAAQKEAKELKIERLSLEECRENGKKFALLRKAFYEENSRRQLSFLIQLGRYFSEDLLTAVHYQEIYYEPDKGNDECAVTRQETVQREEPEIVEITENTKAADNAEPAEMTEEPEEKVLDDSKLQEDKADEELLPMIEKYREDLFTEEDRSLLKLEKSPHEEKKFGVNNFKNDMKKQYCRAKQICMVMAYQDCGMTPESTALIRNEQLVEFEAASEKLLQNGYFRKYLIDGYGSFYCLSMRGYKAFFTKESASFLNQNHYKEESGAWIKDTANSALARFLFFQSFLLTREINKEFSIKKKGTSLGTDYFMTHIPKLKQDRDYIFTGIVSENKEEFCEYAKSLVKSCYLKSSECVVFMGLTDKQGKAAAQWMLDAFADSFVHKTIYYWGYHQKKLECLKEYPEDEPDKPKETEEEFDEPKYQESSEQKPKSFAHQVKHTEKREKLPIEEKTACIELYQRMLCQDKPYCAVAYLCAAAQKSLEMEQIYNQLAYALNDPMKKCSYHSEKLFEVYFNEMMPVSEYFVVSAILRNYFYDQCSYDYYLPRLKNAVDGFSILSENTALHQILYDLQEFKAKNGNSIDKYADYRERERADWEKNLLNIRKEAKDYFDNYIAGTLKENASHKRFIETRKLLFARNGDISTYLQVVIEDDREMISLMEEFLQKTYIKENAVICKENIEPEKIHAVLDRYWVEAARNMRLVKKTSDLMSSLRMNLYKLVSKVVEVLCQYVSLISLAGVDENNESFVAYRKIRSSLIQMMDEAVFDCQGAEETDDLTTLCGKKVLTITLNELRARLEGSYEDGSNRYFYLPFLKNDKVHLDDSFFPVLDDVFELPDLSACSRIEQHFMEKERSFEERMEEITRGDNDDFGTASLILAYAKDTQRNSGFHLNKEYDIERDLPNIEADAKNKRDAFIEDLELAQSYGQIDNTEEDKKETIIQIMDTWYLWAFETHNYGFFKQILKEFMEKIKTDSQSRAAELTENLHLYLEKNNEEKSEQKKAAVEQIKQRIRDKNYAAAEDLLNRLVADDLDAETDLNQEDYLMQFLEEHDFHYRRTANSSITLRSILSAGRTNKDTRGANRLLDNWLRGNGVGESKVGDLLGSLGFDVGMVKLQPAIQGKIENYLVKLKKPQNGRKSNYKHPIAAFGSQAETDGFRAVCLFGKMDAGRLMDTFKEIGNAKNTLIFLDYSLPLADRRELARKVKLWGSRKIFAVVDRVVLTYLVKHYTETSINRMLMAVIMPFASYQPYISDSANIMPPEIFIGRKHELEKIESPTGVNIVYGGRQLGKSALLRMAKNDIDRNENKDRAVVIDIKDLDEKNAAKKISAELFDEGILKEENITEDWQILAREIKNRLRDEEDKIPYLLLMLDEADVFIDSCEKVKYQPFDALKDVQSVGTGRFKFVIAGLRNIVRFKKNIALSNNRVLTQLESMTITPFKSTEARELLEIPLSYLGFRFPKPETDILVSTIFGTTNYFPGLLQLYCSKLIETMKKDYANYTESETPPYIVQEEQIKKVLAQQGLQQQIREKFFITLKVDEDDYYYIIALIIASCYHHRKQKNGCNAEDILLLAEEFSIRKITDLGKEKVLALMEEMRELNILQLVGDGRYRFARYSFCQMMGTVQQIEDEILTYMED